MPGKRAALLILLLSILFIVSDQPDQLYGMTDSVIIEDFCKSGDSFFREWRNMDSSENPWNEYHLLSENGKYFLRGSTEKNADLSIQIGKAVNKIWNIYSHPVLSWEWRVHAIPSNGNESRSSKNDSAAGIYVLFQRKKVPLLGMQYQPMNWIKYVWSSNLPVGTVIPRWKKKSGVTLYEGRYVVVASGLRDTGKWLSFRRDVLADYRNFYGGDPLSGPLMIAILTDSNKTKSRAVADYANIAAYKN